MPSHVGTKVKRSTSASKLRNAGSVGETKFSKDRDLTQVTLHNWRPVMHNCGLNLQPSQMITSTLICDPLTIKWGAGRMRIPAYDTFRDGFEPGVKANQTTE